MEISDPVSETNFGPWMLVSRRRGRARGRGASACATHMNPDVAADPRDASNGPRSASMCSMRGGSRGSGRGGHREAFSDSSFPTLLDVTPPTNVPKSFLQLQDASPPKAPPKDFNNLSSFSKPVGSPNQQPIHPLTIPKIINPSFAPMKSPPPVIRPATLSSPPSHLLDPNCSYATAVDRVVAALDGDPVEGSDEEDSFSDEDGSAMSDDEESDDLMMLDQYQEEVRREALITKGSHTGTSSQKKGRLELGDPCS